MNQHFLKLKVRGTAIAPNSGFDVMMSFTDQGIIEDSKVQEYLNSLLGIVIRGTDFFVDFTGEPPNYRVTKARIRGTVSSMGLSYNNQFILETEPVLLPPTHTLEKL